jgi:hypothetical protein
MPAGFQYMVLASSASAPAPANPFPEPLALCSKSAKPDAKAEAVQDPEEINATTIAIAE